MRRAQVQLATFFLARGDEPHARRIFEDMKDERSERLAAVRDELLTEERAQYWEFTDRGVNFSYLPPERRAHVARFFSWFGRARSRCSGSSLRSRLRRRRRPTRSVARSPTGRPTAGRGRTALVAARRRSRRRTWRASRSPGSTAPATCSTARNRSARARSRSRPSWWTARSTPARRASRVFALDPETGARALALRPRRGRARGFYIVNCRGVSHWLDAAAPERAFCRRRIFVGTLDARLIALDARERACRAQASATAAPSTSAPGSASAHRASTASRRRRR